MTVRLANDPYRYIRRVKGGKFQARPWNQGERFNLGSSFLTRDAARRAIQEFWWGKRKERPKYVRAVRRKGWGILFVVVVRIGGLRERVWNADDVDGLFPTREAAAAAVKKTLIERLGRKAAVAMRQK